VASVKKAGLGRDNSEEGRELLGSLNRSGVSGAFIFYHRCKNTCKEWRNCEQGYLTFKILDCESLQRKKNSPEILANLKINTTKKLRE
jgi:hypothetical protein